MEPKDKAFVTKAVLEKYKDALHCIKHNGHYHDDTVERPAYFIQKIQEAIEKDVHVLEEAEYQDQIEDYEGYITPQDIGKYCYDDGEVFVGVESLEGWVNDERNGLKEGFPNFEDYIKMATILDYINFKNHTTK